MKTIKIHSLLFFSIFTIAACGDNSPSNKTTELSGDATSSTAIEGKWQFQSMKCNDQFVSISQYTETITINGNQGTIENEGYDLEPCAATETFTFTQDKHFAYLTSHEYSCEQTSCDFIFNVNGLPTRYRCPLSWPFAYGAWAYNVNGNTLYISRDGECVSEYQKIE